MIYGTRLFGKVDAVPGMFHVATKFFHINFMPLIPTQGWLVVERDGSDWKGIAIPVSMKSVLVAWIRLVLFWCALLGLLNALAGSLVPLTIGLLGLVGFIGSYRWSWISTADVERAMELAQQAGLGPEAVNHIRLVYGLPLSSSNARGHRPDGPDAAPGG
jgi:hypothetical protein